MSLSLTVVVLVVVFIGLVQRLWRIGSREQGLPPGPPTLPLLGNLLVFPRTRAHLKFTEWARSYGDIYSLKIGSGTAIVVSSPKMARECFELHGATTSDRPVLHVAELVYKGLEMPLARYGPHWRNLRRAAHDLLNKEACLSHLPIQRAEASQLMYDVLQQPQHLYGHIRRYAASVALSVIFGIHCSTYDNPVIEEFYECQRKWEHILRPGGHPPVDIFPILKYIPERWASWKGLCREVRSRQRKLYFTLLQNCIDRIKLDRRNNSFIEYVLEHEDHYGLTREMTGYLGLSLMEGGADTTAIYLQFFLVLMLAHPDVKARAQKEIDDVIGDGRSPDLEDIEHLPYIRALINEVHRCRPAAPTSIPHAATTDERIGGFFIPKGSMIFMNIWGIGRDPDLFEEPERFWPERFLNSEHGTKPEVDTTGCRSEIPMSFGGGRRICPGFNLAYNSIAMNVMNILWAFDINLPKDPATGKPIVPDEDDTTDGILLTPKPFKYDITPRSEARGDIIRTQFGAAKPTFELFDSADLKA
ncbi:unnamed protein product [Somion occarium]|uniref:Cytochrome P450 n=1 Tax=Somion occarium TaxID=3059160 RepID=A0ABP1DHU3_9APHY